MAADKGIHPSQPLPTSGAPAMPSGREPLRVSFKFTEFKGRFCLSLCDPQEAKIVIECFRKLIAMRFADVYAQGGGGKTGLGFTFYDESDLRRVSRPEDLSRDVRIAAIRASDKFRIFGGVASQTFYVLWFDRNHEIVPT